MEDGPESAEGNYPYRDKIYRLVEVESERWQVLDADIYLGQIVAVSCRDRSGPLYTIDFAGQEDQVDEPATEDWRRAVEVLIERSPVGQIDD